MAAKKKKRRTPKRNAKGRFVKKKGTTAKKRRAPKKRKTAKKRAKKKTRKSSKKKAKRKPSGPVPGAPPFIAHMSKTAQRAYVKREKAHFRHQRTIGGSSSNVLAKSKSGVHRIVVNTHGGFDLLSGDKYPLRTNYTSLAKAKKVLASLP